jgi:hypothetical protein
MIQKRPYITVVVGYTALSLLDFLKLYRLDIFDGGVQRT